MAAAVPAAIGLGGSIFSGISNKNAAKKQQQQAAEQWATIKPLIEAQAAGSKYAIDASKPFLQQGQATLRGATQGVQDLQRFWSPLMGGNRSAIDQFLSPERGQINDARNATLQNIMRAPRGPGRIAAGAMADIAANRQKNDLYFGARREGASQMSNLAQLMGSIGGQQTGAGTGLLGAGLSGGQSAMSLYNSQANRAQDANSTAGASLGKIGTSLGGLISDIFKAKGIGQGMKAGDKGDLT